MELDQEELRLARSFLRPYRKRAHGHRRFELAETGEPHAIRRKELLARYPQIRSLFGYDRRTAWVTVAVVIVQFVIAAVIGWQARTGGIGGDWWVVFGVSCVGGAILTHWLSMTIHETSHRSAARTAVGNKLVALMANLPMILPVAMTFHRYHLGHHRDLGVLGRDTDLPVNLEVRLVGNEPWRKAVWVLLHPVVYLLRGATFAKPPNRAEILNIVLMVGVNVAIWQLLGPAAFAYLALSFFFAHSLHPVAGHFIHEHYTFAEGQETLSYYGPLNVVTFNVGYHNEHHDFMNIPGSRLPELHRMVPEYRRLQSHSSWTRVLWQFIADREMGAGSRIVRTRDVSDRGRRALAANEGTAHAAR